MPPCEGDPRFGGKSVLYIWKFGNLIFEICCSLVSLKSIMSILILFMRAWSSLALFVMPFEFQCTMLIWFIMGGEESEE